MLRTHASNPSASRFQMGVLLRLLLVELLWAEDDPPPPPPEADMIVSEAFFYCRACLPACLFYS